MRQVGRDERSCYGHDVTLAGVARSIRENARRRVLRLRLALTLLVAMLIAFGSAAPAYARVLFGPADHVCHCEARGGHATCGCPICFPELAADDDGVLPTAKGRCGDDDAGIRTLAQPAVLPALGTVVGVLTRTPLATVLPRPPPPRHDAPEPRPPRSVRVG